MSGASGGIGDKPQGRVGTVINGRWRVDARIGSGGMATVYAVTSLDGDRAALKMLHAQLSRDPSTRARFFREAYVANAIAHPGVVQVEEDGVTEDGIAFLILELLEGETIEARRLRMGGALPLEEVLDTADQALDALAAAHEKRIVHRDVKPENFFLCHDGIVKLLDFGLARMKDAQGETTRTGVTIGTPEFMPPEQALGKRDSIDARSDVWGLGATMFNALSGQYVHDAPTLHEQLVASATQRARPVRSVAPHVPPAVAAVIDKSLELDMNDRWQSAREMQTALRQARDIGGAPVGDESLTFPVASQAWTGPASLPSSSGRTVQMSPDSFETTVALEGPVSGPAASSLPVSPTPVTRRMTADPQPSGFMMQATVPAFTPPSGASPLSATRPFGPHPPPPPPPPPPNAAPTLRSAARPIILAIILFAASAAIGGYLAYAYFLGE